MTNLPWKRFVALGDSMTEGVGDPGPQGELRGWADRLAEALRGLDPDLTYVNLAVRGQTTTEVRETQLEVALGLGPDLASALSGMNDLLQPGFRPESYRDALDSVVTPLVDGGALVLTATYPDVASFLPLPARARARVRRRLQMASAAVREVSERDGVLLLDVERLPREVDRALLSVDRLHPGPQGHLLVARLFAERLGELAGIEINVAEVPDAGRWQQARWLLSNASPREVVRSMWRMRSGG